jgi:alpha-L-arabinofuranosidase
MHRRLAVTFLIVILSACVPAAPTSTPATPTVTSIPTQTPFPTPTQTPTAVPDTLFVDPSVSLGPISPLVYGSNIGPWLSVPFYMLPQTYESGIKILRFPAGAWGDHNDVTHLQIDQFMDFANKMGATAIFNVRLLDGTPEQAADMVRYTNIERKYNVQYWAIGNEPTLFDAELKLRGESYDTQRFNEEWRTFAEAMKEVDPTIKLVGAEINQFSYDPTPGATTNFSQRDEEWFVEFLKANGDLVDIVSFHRYPFPESRVSGPPSIDELRENAQEWDKIIIHARELIHQHTGRDLPIAVTEFNSAYDKSVGGEATPDSHYNAIWMADVLGRMIKNDVFMANEWALSAKGGAGGLGLIGALEVYPAYYTYQLYKKFGNELIYSSSDDPDLSVYAARAEDGSLTVMVINLSLEEKIKAIRIADQTQAEAWLFDLDHAAENVGTINLSNEITIPPQSVTLYIVAE